MPREMKDSGIEWLDKIPKSWTVSRLNYECYIRARLGWKGLKADEYVQEGYPLLSAFNIQNNHLVWSPLNFITQKRYDESPEIKLKIGDILLVKDGAGIGKTARIDTLPFNGATTNSSLGVLTPYNNLNYRYLSYYLQSAIFSNFINRLLNGMGVPHLTQEVLNSIKVLIPSLHEQQEIADYLDHKCNEIDALHADIEKQIAILEDYKKSIITEAVTKGLNPDVEMKDSGNTYWSTIPKHWNLSDIKYLFEIVKRIAGKEGYDILSVTQRGLKIKDISNNEGQIAESYANYQFVYPNDFVMNHMDLLTGWVDCSQYFGVTSPDYRVFRLRNQTNNLSYYKYVMQVCYMNKIFYSLGQGVSTLGRWRLQTSSFNNFQIPVPPLKEQQEIADYLDQKKTEIDAIISAKKQQLDILDNYKKSLIYEYVTGKKEVPSYANAE